MTRPPMACLRQRPFPLRETGRNMKQFMFLPPLEDRIAALVGSEK